MKSIDKCKRMSSKLKSMFRKQMPWSLTSARIPEEEGESFRMEGETKRVPVKLQRSRSEITSTNNEAVTLRMRNVKRRHR